MRIETILVEGWRFVPHSYAIVNQWQCLQLLNRNKFNLFMHDLPFAQRRWKPVRGLFDAASEAAIAALSELPAGGQPDATLRLVVPVPMRPAPHGRTFVLGTADFGWLPRAMLEGRVSLKEAHAGTDVVIVTPSAWSSWGLIRAGADPSRVAVVPHGVDTTLFRPVSTEARTQLRSKLGWQSKFVFLNVSAMTLSKGPDLLMKAFARVAPKYEHAQLVLKGIDATYDSGSLVKQWWKEWLSPEERQACKGRITYLGGTLPFRELTRLYQAADAFVSPYRSESFNMPVLEAVACGLPVICTRGGPTDDFTQPDFARRIDSEIVPKVKRTKASREKEPEELEREPNIEHLTELMREVLESNELCQQARRCGPALVDRQFTWRHAVDRLLKVMSS